MHNVRKCMSKVCIKLMTMSSTDFSLGTVPGPSFPNLTLRCQDACKMSMAFISHMSSPLSSMSFNIMKYQIYNIKLVLEKNFCLQLTKFEKKGPFIYFKFIVFNNV